MAAATNAEMAFQFADFFDQAYDYLNADLDTIHQWLIKAMSAYDEKGLMSSIKVFQGVKVYAEELDKQKYAVTSINRRS